jgi:putative NADPH-quinone reductase
MSSITLKTWVQLSRKESSLKTSAKNKKRCEHLFTTTINGPSKPNDALQVKAADLIIFHYQTLLHDIPAILLGWMQRVLMPSFAFDVRQNNIFDEGLLKVNSDQLSMMCYFFVTLGQESHGVHFLSWTRFCVDRERDPW